MDKVGAEVVTNLLIIADGPEGEFAAFAHFQAADVILQTKRARPIDSHSRQRFFQAHAHRGHGKIKNGLHIFAVRSAWIEIGGQSNV